MLISRPVSEGQQVPAAPSEREKAPVVTPPPTRKREEEEPPPEEYLPPEEPVFDDDPFTQAPPAAQQPPQTQTPPKQDAAPVFTGERESAEVIFGKFMRHLRKSSKNGVLFTMCVDLSPRFEGDLLVFYTQSETIFRSLNRDAQRAAMGDALRVFGVESFEVRLASSSGVPKGGIEELKRDFKNYQIDIK